MQQPKTGLTLGKAGFINAIKNNICHKVRRELVASSLDVFPLQDYGAIEIGRHNRLTRLISFDHLPDRERRALKKH